MSRVHVMNCYRTSNRPHNKYKSYWKLFLKPFETLEAFNYHKVHLFKRVENRKEHYKLLIRCRCRTI